MIKVVAYCTVVAIFFLHSPIVQFFVREKNILNCFSSWVIFTMVYTCLVLTYESIFFLFHSIVFSVYKV